MVDGPTQARSTSPLATRRRVDMGGVSGSAGDARSV